MCKVYTGYCGTSEIEHGLCACTVDNPLAKARELSLRTGAQPMLYLPQVKSIALGTVDDPFHYRPRPGASCGSSLGRPQHSGR